MTSRKRVALTECSTAWPILDRRPAGLVIKWMMRVDGRLMTSRTPRWKLPHQPLAEESSSLLEPSISRCLSTHNWVSGLGSDICWRPRRRIKGAV
jgi:hypothetical protein